MAQFILVRHGQTEWNRVERFRGRIDLSLNDTGIAQAKATAQRLAAFRAKAVYSSPLKRALVTAQTIAADQGLSAQPLGDIVDLSFGEWEGLSPEEASQKDPHLYHLWLTQPHLVQFPGGESLDQVRARAMPALGHLAAAYASQTIILVSHKVVCKVILCAVLGLDNSHYWRVEQDTCAINIFEMSDAGIWVKLINDTCHLKNL